MPTTRPGTWLAAAMSAMGSEEVFVARIAWGGACRPSVCEDVPLQVEDLGHGLDDQVRVGGGRAQVRGRRCDAAEYLVAEGRLDLALRHALVEVLPHVVEAGLDPRGVDVVERGLVARLGGDLGDAVPHGARADDQYSSNVHLASRKGWVRSRGSRSRTAAAAAPGSSRPGSVRGRG